MGTNLLNDFDITFPKDGLSMFSDNNMALTLSRHQNLNILTYLSTLQKIMSPSKQLNWRTFLEQKFIQMD